MVVARLLEEGEGPEEWTWPPKHFLKSGMAPIGGIPNTDIEILPARVKVEDGQPVLLQLLRTKESLRGFDQRAAGNDGDWVMGAPLHQDTKPRCSVNFHLENLSPGTTVTQCCFPPETA